VISFSHSSQFTQPTLAFLVNCRLIWRSVALLRFSRFLPRPLLVSTLAILSYHTYHWLTLLLESGTLGGWSSSRNYTAPPATACFTGNAPSGVSASTITATEVVSGSLTSYINTATQCDANTLFKGDDGATEWAGSNSAPSTTGSATSGLTQWHNPATTNYFKVVVSTLDETTTSSVPTTIPNYSSLYTGTGSIRISTSESSAPYHNLTTESSTSSSTISKGTAVSTSLTAPITTSTSTPNPSDPCAGTGGSRHVDANGVAYEVISGADSSINSYSNSEESSIKDCFARCDEQAQCQGYTYVTSGIPSGICYLKNEIGEFIQNNNTVNMCSAFRCATPANGTTTFTPSGSIVPPPNTSSAPYKNSTIIDPSTITSSPISSVFQNSTTIGPSSITSSATSSAFQNSTIIDPSSITSSATSSVSQNSTNPIVTSLSVSTETKTLTEKYGNNTTTATVEIPHTITVTEVTQSATAKSRYVLETITFKNGSTTVVPCTSTTEKWNHHTHATHNSVPHTSEITSYETKTLTQTKTNANGTTAITETFTLPHVKTVTPPVSVLTKTVYASSVVTRPCTKTSCPKSATTSVSRYNTTIVESITASCSTLPPVIVTKTSTIETTLGGNSNKTITFESCDTYTEPATSMWVYVPCNTTTTSLGSASSTTTLSSPKSANATTTTISLNFANATSILTSGTGVPAVPCNTTTSSINSANLTSTQSFTTSTIFTTSVRTVSSLNSTSLSTTSIRVSTTVVPVPNTPLVPTTAPGSSVGSSAVGSSAVGSSAVGSSAVGSSAVRSSAVGSSAGSSPVSPVTADTTQTTRVGSTSQLTVPVTVTATRPGVSSPVSVPSHVASQQPVSSIASKQPSNEKPSIPVSVSLEGPLSHVASQESVSPIASQQPSGEQQSITKSAATSARKTYTEPHLTPTATPSGPATSKLNANTTLSEKTKANHIPPTASATAVAGASAKNSNNVVAGLAVVAAAMMVL
jgi:hypothetical protein